MAIETNLNQSPYFDDFSEDKNFHRILFRPGYAVQARELTQMQTILQNQIERFANEVMIDGTIVTGGGLITDQTNYVKLRDKDANNRVLLLSDFYENGVIANCTITGATTGMTGKLVSAVTGSEAAAPDYLTVYCHYTNSGSNNTTKAFGDNETLIFRRSSNSEFIVAANTITASATGKSMKANISDGIVYHKGNFIRMPSQSVIVGRYSVTPNAYIGITTTETLIDSNDDSSLLDNSTGSSNYTAPGAERLKLYPTLTVQDYGFANTSSYFTIAVVEGGSIVQRNDDTIYSDIGKFVAERLYDTNGNFVVQPFNLRVREHLKKTNSLGRYTASEGGDADKLVVEIEKGIGYVSGDKIQLQAARFLDVDKATAYNSQNAVVVGQAVGNYVYVNECVGTFEFFDLGQVTIYNAAQQGITGKNLGNQSAQGTAIGTCKIRGFGYDSGTMGTATGKMRLYIFDVNMNSGYSFADARSFHIDNGSYNSMADIVLTNGSAKLQETNLNTLVFPVGQKGLKTLKDANDVVDTQFVYRAEKNVTIPSTGTVTVTANTPHAGGTETMNETGTLSASERRNILVIARETVETAAHTGTISGTSGNTVTGSGTSFDTQYRVGDFIAIGANNPERITEITNATTIKVANTYGGSQTGAHKTVFPSGYIFDLTSNGSITSTSSQHSIDLGTANLASSFAATVYFNRLRSDAVQTAKTVNKDKFIHINTGSHSASKSGPWPLGVADAFKLVAVYKGTNTAVTTSDSDVTSHFELDSGMKDAMYDNSYLVQKKDSSLDLTNCGLMVKFNYFGRDRSSGIGYLSVDSYPVDNANTANTTAITTQEIPVFRSPTSDRVFDLRDHIDMRPIKSNSVTPNAVGAVGTCPTNPAASTTFNVDSDGAFMPTPDENFQCDLQYYLPRKDRVVVTKGGAFSVIKGVPDLSPQTPSETAGAMTLGVLDIPPYPSLSPYVAKVYERPEYAVKMTLENNRRYTMKDLRSVEQRVRSLEYYSTLNLLEAQTKNKQLLSTETGADRFKNGFFVDDMGSHVNVDTQNPYYRAAIDVNEGMLRPTFERSDISLTKDVSLSSSNVTKTGDIVTLSYTHTALIDQPYASKLRNPVQELMFNWRGQVTLDPPADNTPDITQLPDVQLDFSGFYDAIETIANRTGLNNGQIQWGGWVQSGRTRTNTGVKTTLSSVTETISLGNTIENISVREYMRSREIRFTATRMKPNTRVYAYFDDEKVSDYCTPTNSSFVDTGVEGAALVTDSSGNLYGKFRLPNDTNLKFRVGTKRFVLKDISDPITQADLVTTTGHGDFTSNPLEITMRGTDVNMQIPQFSQQTVVEKQVLHTVADGDRSWWDPIAQTFTVNISGTNDGVFITKMDLYFGKKDSTLPITLQIREVVNGFPTETIVPYAIKTLPASSVNTSADASTATTFTFDTPVFLKNQTDYAFIVIPGGNSDQYAVWTAQLGGSDVFRPNTIINKQTYSGVLFSSSNDKTWNPIQDEDIKFTMYRAEFSTSTGTVYMENSDQDYFTIDNIDGTFRVGESITSESVLTVANTSTLTVGQVLKSKAAYDGAAITNTNFANGAILQIVDNTAGATVVKLAAIGTFPNTSTASAYNIYDGAGTLVGTTTAHQANAASGTVSFFYGPKNKLYVSSSTGYFANGYVRGQKSGAQCRVVTVDDLQMNSVVPKLPEIKYNKTSAGWAVRSTSSAGAISSDWVNVTLGEENNFYDNEKKVYSVSNESSLTPVGGSTKSFVLRGTMSTTDSHVSPVIDTTRANAIILGNNINNDNTDEHKEVGNASVRYISKKITLADGQDAEDMVVYMNAFKPVGTDIQVYARIINGEDGEAFTDKDYTPLTQITASNTYSSGFDGRDIKEFEFGFSANTDGQGFLTTANNFARLNSSNSEIVAYRGTDGAIYHSYKTFAIKIVMTSTGTNLVPLVDDLRVIALQK